MFVREVIQHASQPTAARFEHLPGAPEDIVIVGGGAAGHAAVETLRRLGYDRSLTLISADDSPPYDRPSASNDYLAGVTPDAWLPLHPAEYYEEQEIDLRLGRRVTTIDVPGSTMVLDTGEFVSFDAALLATGAEAVRLNIPGSELPHVRTLRTLADSRSIIALSAGARSVVVIGGSFIGLEVAASLRARKLDVHVVSPTMPLEAVLGDDFSELLMALHEANGVVFHLGLTPHSIDRSAVKLNNGQTIPADLVVVGIGVRPSIALAEDAGLKTNRGVVVDPFLETSAPGICAAGDIACYPDPRTGRDTRIEHWVVAERQGAVAAANMLGLKLSAVVAYEEEGRIAAMATLGRDRVNLEAEVALATDDQATLRRLLSGARLAPGRATTPRSHHPSR